ncbi:Hypothetical Protein FCC1311_031742 [Hondaea fermentalgiana]|uniref:Uncharacterized protein n=1 Tax=Hondaea fermentalgiana TaxID=2315210 RepID=A0A2R5GFC4_9STRA|nr:Hypothetical Protein FCC1311_031742 [Hondaea fermentalgiana]|eukprot:GBG26951.1 Hypothetical Protein FCC1311_031742 [Hondaea fermentalgiana]
MDRQELEALGRRDLQALAKKHGVKANAKSALIVDELLEIFTAEAVAPEAESKESISETRAEETLARDDGSAKEEEEEDNDDNEEMEEVKEEEKKQSEPKDATEEKEETVEVAASLVHPTLERAKIPSKTRRIPSRAHTTSTADAATTLEEKKEPTTKVSSSSSSSSSGAPVAKKSASKKKIERTKTTETAKTKRVQRKNATEESKVSGAAQKKRTANVSMTGKPSKADSTSAVESPPKRRRIGKEKENAPRAAAPLSQAKQSAKTPGRFDRAHAKLFSTQKSIVDTQGARGSKTVVKAKRAPTAESSRFPKSAVKPGRAPLAASSAGVGATNTPTRKDRSLVSGTKPKTARKPMFRVDTTSATPSIADPKVSSTTSASSAAAKKRPKFDLQESLKRPITWKMKTGPLR